jgi:hypothetical protein
MAWLHRTIFPPIQSTFQPNVTMGSAGELQQGVVDMPYAIPNVRCENGPATAHVRIGWYQSVFNIPHAFAVCSFAVRTGGPGRARSSRVSAKAHWAAKEDRSQGPGRRLPKLRLPDRALPDRYRTAARHA